MTCPACGATAPDGARFCPECGQRLVASPEERRLVTVLMADLVGYTTMSAEADPEHVKRFVDQCFERLVADVTAFGGRLDKIVGDQIVALFGTPVAHEDDAERAVRAALRMHETLMTMSREMAATVQVRIGVNTGEVLAGAVGEDYTVVGDVVNTAQRLQTLAEPGRVVVGPATQAATRDVIRYEPLGAVELKGRGQRVEAYCAIEALTPPGRRRVRERTPLVGRDTEIGTLRHVLRMAGDRHHAHVVVLFGDAGVGKSRLATEIAEIARNELGAQTLTGQCVPYGDTNMFGPLGEALRHACGIEGMPRGADARTRVIETVTGTLRLAPDAPETTRVVEGLMYVMEGVPRPGVDPMRARDDAIRSVIAFFEALAARGPLVLTLSDVHWADDELFEVCERLLGRLRHSPFVLVATARPGFETRWTPESGRHNALVLHLDPLDDEATVALVHALSGGEADDALIAFLLERSGGNPFFVEELVAFVQESADGERVQELPATLHGLVAARLDSLGAAERSVLEDCAVIGSSGPISAVLAVAGQTATRDLLDGLAERDLLVLDADDFRFKSELIREIAYGTLTKAERARRHAALAPVLEARGESALEQVAGHLATAADLVGEIGTVPGVPADVRAEAIAALYRAAGRAEDVESWLVSGRHFDRVLSLLPHDGGEERWPALLGRARARVAHRDLGDARDDAMVVLEEARAADATRVEAHALTILAEAHAAAGDYDLAETTYGEAVQLWRELEDASGAANALRGLGMSHLFRGEHTQADHLISEALASYRTTGNRRGEAWALQNLAWISFSRGKTTEAETRLQQSADLFGELGDWGGLGWAFGLLSWVRYNQGRLDEAAEIAEQIATEGRETGNLWAVGMMGVLLANIALWRGHNRDSVRRGRDAQELFVTIGDNWGEVQALGPVVRALAELGRDDEYAAALERLEEIAPRLPDENMRGFPAAIAACIALQRGESERAIVLVEQSPHDDETIANTDWIGTYGLALLQEGDVAAAITQLEKGYNPNTGQDGPVMALGDRLALAYAAAHRVDDALDVVEHLSTRAGGTYSDRIYALFAESLARVRRRDPDARAAIDAAHTIATATDAPLEHAVAALARSHVLRALVEPDAAEVAADAQTQLDGLGITAAGWTRVFDLALAGVDDPTPTP